MKARLRVVAWLLALSLAIAAVVAGIGVLIAVLRDSSVRDSIAYALWGAGAVVILFVGLSSSPGRNLAQGRDELGGRMTGAALAPNPLGYVLIGVVLVGIGVLVYAYG